MRSRSAGRTARRLPGARRARIGACLATLVLLLAVPVHGAGAGTSASLRERICGAAQQEGVLQILSTPGDRPEAMARVLRRAFPELQVRIVADVAAPSRAVTEAQAGVHAHDVFVWSVPGVLPLYERQLLAQLSQEETRAFGVHPGSRLLGGAALGVSTAVHALAYHSRRVAAQEAPRSWRDLLDPRWRGRLAGDIISVSNGVAALGLVFGEAWALDFARQLRDEVRITLLPSETIARDLVLRGEKDLSWGALGIFMDWKERRGMALDWASVSPTYAARIVVSVFARAPHPQAARCAALWWASAEGKVALEAESFDLADVSPGSPARMRKELDARRVRVFVENVESARRRLALYGQVAPVLLGQRP